MSSPHTPKQNHLLAALPAADYARLLPDLELIPMPLGWAVYESGGRMGYLYFPTTSIVSLLYVMESGASAEIAITGNEGLVGISLFMGGESTPSRAVVQSAGNGYRLKASVLKREFALGGHAAASGAALHAGADHADGADRGVQPAPFGGPATVPLAAVEPGPACRSNELIDDAGADREHAGRAPRGRDRGRRQAAGGRVDSLQPRPDHRAGSPEAGSAGLRVLCAVSQTAKPTGCFPLRRIPAAVAGAAVGVG